MGSEFLGESSDRRKSQRTAQVAAVLLVCCALTASPGSIQQLVTGAASGSAYRAAAASPAALTVYVRDLANRQQPASWRLSQSASAIQMEEESAHTYRKQWNVHPSGRGQHCACCKGVAGLLSTVFVVCATPAPPVELPGAFSKKIQGNPKQCWGLAAYRVFHRPHRGYPVQSGG